jgi:hypothetical protein
VFVHVGKNDPQTWTVALFNFPEETRIAQDLKMYGKRFGQVRRVPSGCAFYE